ncbi:thioredoxin [Natronospira bacteriovora]|uniref:Thioredoxin n=1 Tax=Natronospira bacteriovora TaxID=3069753 RepID=A0ABU0W506_9GAMM|nr:thioredoxin [Natronospira sp. AB-CW4]MDQ2069076.1 thioredoxin [Natronospira sp. AB-CW4]
MPGLRLRLFLTLLLSLSPTVVAAPMNELHMLVFHSDTCPHCEAQKPFIEALDESHEALSAHFFELRHNEHGRALFRAVASAHGTGADSVPAVFVGGRAWLGDSRLIRHQITSHVEHCLEMGDCPDSRDTRQRFDQTATAQETAPITLPLLGTIDLMVQPLTVSTALIAFIDGFNPCSLWVLTILLALVIHSGSRRRILTVGLTFLGVTATIYGLFIMGVFGALTLLLTAAWVYWVVATLALVFAGVNIKDYFWFQRGVSFTIDEKHKPGIYRRFRGLIRDGRSTPALIAATAVMASGIAFIELPCTAGFPVIWSGIVASHGIDWLSFSFLLGLYLLVYLSIEMVVFLVALTTLRVDRFEERHGRILKLVGGIIMLALAGVLLLAPELMHDIRGAIAVFLIAFGAAALILFTHRYLLPKLGVHIGDEW